MKNILNPNRTVSVILVLLLCIFSYCNNSVCIAASREDFKGDMNIDIVFVIDGSDSMNTSDPHKKALDAMKLFYELMDESCGIGYVLYTHKITNSSGRILPLDSAKYSAELKNEWSKIKYYEGDTDIALGLSEALKYHKENGTDDSDRKKAVVLLSDGDTHLLNLEDRRTEAESEKELEKDLKELKDLKIPVYAIGLNYTPVSKFSRK